MVTCAQIGWKRNTADSYCRGKRVEPLQEILLLSQEMSVYFLWPFNKMAEWHIKLHRNRFLPQPFIFVVG
jgi:hypothetical protein